MREVSQSLAIAFNIGQAQEALYRSDAGEQLGIDEQALFTRIARLFSEAELGLEWTQATVTRALVSNEEDQPAREQAGTATRALRSLSLVLPVIRNAGTPKETLELLAETARKLGAGQFVSKESRATFDAIMSDLARYVGGRAGNALEERGAAISLLPIPK
jgi:hypothetical protein